MKARSLLARLGIRRLEHVSVARDFSIYSIVNIASLVLLLATALVLRRTIGPYLAGVWTALELLPTYVAYTHLGTLTAAERELPFLLGARRPDDFDRLKHTLFWLTHGLGGVLAAALVVAAFATASRVSQPTFIGLFLYAPILWAQLVSTYYIVLYRARKRFVALSGRQGIANLLKAGLLVAGGYGFGIYGVLVAELAAALLFVALLKGSIEERFERRFEPSLLTPLLADGVPMLAGAVAFELLRGADQIVILAQLGPSLLGVYSVTSLVCQGVYYLPNALSTVMYPRFQQRYGETGSAESLRRFVELQLHMLADTLLAAIAVLFVALPPVISRFFPQYIDTIAPLRIMLVGTYFLCLTPPAGQFLLTVHKQRSALLLGLPATAVAFVAGYVGARRGLVGVAAGVSAAGLLEFVGLNAYAFAHLEDAARIGRRLMTIIATAGVVMLIVLLVERYVPPGPPVIAVLGGWRLAAVAVLTVPLMFRAVRRLRSLARVVPDGLNSTDLVDNAGVSH